jgi:2-polyprenyl-6-methoxyphenol hydroxylase-like FAD-dependent oxidoreductase
VPSTERVVIIGGGIGGLAVALALGRTKRELVIVERDPEPPEIAPEDAFERWARPGVPQFRHAHILLARLQTMVRDQHPELLAELLAAGCELSTFTDALPAPHLPGYRPLPGDEDLLHLWGRRATFEYVLRRHVGRMSNVRFVHSARVDGLISEDRGRQVRVCGVELTRDDKPERLQAELVIDASGKRTKAPEWLRALGVAVTIDSRPSGFVYACRHYRLRDPAHPPSRRDGGGNLDYLGYATFYAEHGHYALTFGCPSDEKELADAMRRPEGFEALCAQFPVLQRWRSVSEPTTKVLGAGLFANTWIDYRTPGERELLGFLAVGDSHVETNPMYGRGCSAAFVQAEALAEALQANEDPSARARDYYERTRAQLYPVFELSANTDRLYHVRAKLRRGRAVPLPERVLNFFYERAFLRANQESLLVAREFVKATQMRETSSLAIRIAAGWQLLLALLRGLLRRDSAKFLPEIPEHAELLQRLALPSATGTAPNAPELEHRHES